MSTSPFCSGPRTALLGVVVVVVTCVLPACSDAVPLERSDAECTDKQDNDGDGLIDCDDPDCRARPICQGADGSLDGPLHDAGSDLPAGGEGGVDTGLDGNASDTFAAFSESEPNDGKTTSELNTISVPAVITGAIGAANDADVFGITAKAGDRLTVRAQSGGQVQIHLAVFGDAALSVPAAVNAFGHGNDALAEYYVLESGTYYVAVRDRRNVGSTPAGVGGPAFGYTLTVEPLTRPPVAIAVGGTLATTIAPPGTVRVFSFTAQQDDDLELLARAQALTPASDVDTRLSLFHPAQSAWLGTNDNPSLSETDSRLTGKMPFGGTFHAIVENVADSGSDLRVEFELRAAP